MSGARTRLLVAGSLLVVAGALALAFRGAGSDAAETSVKSSAPPRSEAPVVEATRPGASAEQVDDPPNLRAPQVAGAVPAEIEASLHPDPKTLTRLAETSDDPEVVESAFAAILSTHAARSTRKPGPDAELSRAIAKHVRSARPSTVRAALNAARIPLMTVRPSETVARALATLAAPDQDPARRYAAIETLNLIRPNQRDESVLLAFEGALVASEPHVVAMALLALAQSRGSIDLVSEALRQRLSERTLALLDHHDPGVRGQALLVLSEVPSLQSAAKRYWAAVRSVRDPDPCVRGRAADLFARVRDPAAVHVLIESVRDLTEARHEMRGWFELDGRAGVFVCELPGRKRVAEVALFALLALSETLGEASRLSLTLGGRAVSDAMVLENAEAAERWYSAHAVHLPRVLGTSPPTQ